MKVDKESQMIHALTQLYREVREDTELRDICKNKLMDILGYEIKEKSKISKLTKDV